MRRRLSGKQLFPRRHLPLIAERYTLNGDHWPHDHDFLEVVLVVGGQGWQTVAWGEQELAAGDAFLMRPGAWHCYRNCRNLEVYNCCFGVELTERELASTLQDPILDRLLWSGPLAPDAQGMVTVRLDDSDCATCRAYLEGMRSVEATDAERVGNLLLFLARLARRYADSGSNALSPHPHLHPAVREAVRLLDAEMAYAWTLPELAQRVCLNEAYLSRRFRQGIGVSPMAYLTRCRVERAAQLLLRTTQPITQIAAEVGWSDSNYFARRFRDHFGQSATAYRAARRSS